VESQHGRRLRIEDWRAKEVMPEEVRVPIDEIPRLIRLEDDAGKGVSKAESIARGGSERAGRSGLSSQ
jgi:hypothetical protein